MTSFAGKFRIESGNLTSAAEELMGTAKTSAASAKQCTLTISVAQSCQITLPAMQGWMLTTSPL
eukprot:CAMPEP_0115591374 /NCGR_PEP_ID=MMETSP0272-20121206/10242_1 /TAXON_ID=71861 /ORGANISM="Scrippsiella trochoidea, Strain CCMP3099" /LENGTH=63 /DNA_ID=CAMNT_0003026589 /DNA_START=170 /DNA_END=361 /DNA_ORIENTATION=+